MRIDHLTAVEYVRDHFAAFDYGFELIVIGVGYGEDDTIDVEFEGGVMTVWIEDGINGPFVYGEW